MSETWLKSSMLISVYNVPNYSFVHTCRDSKIGGGVALYISESVDFLERPDLTINNSFLQTAFIEIVDANSKNIIVGNIYRPPYTDIDSFLGELDSLLSSIQTETKLLYLMGDYNINLNTESHAKSKEFLDTMFLYNLFPVITKPTRISDNSATVIDNIFTNAIQIEHDGGLLYSDISDHFPIFYVAKKYTHNLPVKESCFKRLINDSRIDDFKKKLSCVDWNPIYASKDVNHAYDMFYSIFYRIYNECLPVVRNKIIKKRRIHKPWISSGILKSINKKNNLYKDFRKYSGPLKTKRKKEEKYKKI